MTALHLSHTDIRTDSRILKEIDALQKGAGFRVYGLGISEDGGRSGDIQSIANRSIGYSNRSVLLTRIRKALFRLSAFGRLFLSALRTRTTVVHCHDWFVLPIGVAHKIRWRSRLVYDAHELESDTNTRSRIRKRGAFWVERLCWRWIDGFITVSDSILTWYFDHFKVKEHAAVVLNSPVFSSEVETGEDRSPGRNEINEELGIGPGKTVGVYVGGLERGRGLEIMLNAVSGIQEETHLLIIGYGSAEDRLKAMADQLGCDNVTFLGRMPHDSIVPFISRCDYGVCLIEPVSLSDVFSLPNKLFEYSFAGLHIFGSNLPEIEQYLDTTGLGTVVELDPLDLRRAIVDLPHSSPRTLSSGPPAEYGWVHQADKLVDLYRHVYPIA